MISYSSSNLVSLTTQLSMTKSRFSIGLFIESWKENSSELCFIISRGWILSVSIHVLSEGEIELSFSGLRLGINILANNINIISFDTFVDTVVGTFEVD